MADQSERVLTNTSYTSHDVNIEAVSIITAKGQVEDISSMFNVINIYENIFKPVITGTIQIFDAVNLLNRLQLNGNEYIRISFSRPNEKEKIKYSKIFRIYKASNREPTNSLDQSYVLHFCSEEQIFSNQITVSKSYKDLIISDYVYDICNNILRIQPDKIGLIEKTIGIQNIIIPRLTPLDAIKLLEQNAFNDSESPFLFFENRDGFNFVSLSTLFNRGSVVTLNYSNAKMSIGPDTNSESLLPFENYNKIIDFNYKKLFDVWESTNDLTYSGRLSTLDLVRQKFTEYDYSIAKLDKRNLIDGGNLPVSFATNRDNKNLYNVFDSNYCFSLTNKDQSYNPYAQNKGFRTVDTNVESTLVQRKSQLNLLKNIIIDSCSVQGNPAFSVGYVVEVNMPSFSTNSLNERSMDLFLSGKYLITHVRHQLTKSGGLSTVLSLAKNSLATSLGYVDNTNSDFAKAKSL